MGAIVASLVALSASQPSFAAVTLIDEHFNVNTFSPGTTVVYTYTVGTPVTWTTTDATSFERWGAGGAAARSIPEPPDGDHSGLEVNANAGADGIYFEGPETEEQLQTIGRKFKGAPLATSVLENGGKTPWLAPTEFGRIGFTMILYPTTLLFRATRAIQLAAKDLRDGKELDKKQSVDMKTFEKIVELDHWQKIEKKFGGS